MQHVLHKHPQSSYYFDDEEPINKKRLISSRVISISVTLNGDVIQGRANIDPSYDVEKKSRMIETLSIPMKRFLLRLLNKMDAQYQNTTHFS